MTASAGSGSAATTTRWWAPLVVAAVLSAGGGPIADFSPRSSMTPAPPAWGCSAFVIVFQQQQPQRPVADIHRKRPTTWLIDGNNFLGQRGTPRAGDQLSDRIRPIATQGADQVVLVFDGRPGEQTRTDVTTSGGDAGSSSSSSPRPTATTAFRTVQLEEGAVADDFIMEEIHAIARMGKNRRVKLVTADKRLRAMALATRPTVKAVVNPVVFWRKYLPRMSGQKKKNRETATPAYDGDGADEDDDEDDNDQETKRTNR
jgi:hypothetical protein